MGVRRMKAAKKIFVPIALALVALPSLAADPFHYDFNNLNASRVPLAGQDSWFTAPGPLIAGSAYVEPGDPLRSADTTPVADNRGLSLNLQWDGADLRPLETPLTYSAADRAAVFMTDAYLDTANGRVNIAAAGPVFTGNAQSSADAGPLIFGLETPALGPSAPRTYLSAVGSGDTLVSGDLYRFKLTVDFSPVGPHELATLYYLDLTAGQTTFTEDSTLRGIAIDLPTRTASYAYLNVAGFNGGTGAAFVDNLDFSAPAPEPTPLPLIASAAIIASARRQHSGREKG